MTRDEIRMKIYKLLWRVSEHKTFPSDALAELNELVVIKVDRELSIISRKRAEFLVPEVDCGGRKYTSIEWEDNVRYLLESAEIQRDKDKYDSGCVAVEPLI